MPTGRRAGTTSLETVASGGGFIDYDGDGDLDIYLLNGAAIPGFVPDRPLSSALYRNEGDGSFTDATGEAGVGNVGGYGMGMAVADYDNDGDDDLFVTNYGENVLYRNEGDGTFRDVTGRAMLTVPPEPHVLDQRGVPGLRPGRVAGPVRVRVRRIRLRNQPAMHPGRRPVLLRARYL